MAALSVSPITVPADGDDDAAVAARVERRLRAAHLPCHGSSDAARWPSIAALWRDAE